MWLDDHIPLRVLPEYSLQDLFDPDKFEKRAGIHCKFADRLPLDINDAVEPEIWEIAPGQVVARSWRFNQVKFFGVRYTDAAKFAGIPHWGYFYVWKCHIDNFALIDGLDPKFYLNKGCLSLWAMIIC